MLNNDTLKILGRDNPLFEDDIIKFENELLEGLKGAKILIIGAAGTIGKATTREIFRRSPKSIIAVDISENNLVELVRDIRSTLGYLTKDFRTYALDVSSPEFDCLTDQEGPFDYILNFSALKHVRSEKDPFTLMRMVQVNILNSVKLARLAKKYKSKKYFCVSTDKAANPVNMMGATKRIMELFLLREANNGAVISMARFANVAFSDGSLLHGFNQRFMNQQPLTAPTDIQRYFVTEKEAGQLCLLSCILAKNKQIFFPNSPGTLCLTNLRVVAQRYLKAKGFKPIISRSEEEARDKVLDKIKSGMWPCYFFKSDTTGEKAYEEFFTSDENVNLSQFQTVGIIDTEMNYETGALDKFEHNILTMLRLKFWNKVSIISEVTNLLQGFSHIEKNKSLDEKM